MICEKFNTQEPLIGKRIVGVQKSASAERGREGERDSQVAGLKRIMLPTGVSQSINLQFEID